MSAEYLEPLSDDEFDFMMSLPLSALQRRERGDFACGAWSILCCVLAEEGRRALLPRKVSRCSDCPGLGLSADD